MTSEVTLLRPEGATYTAYFFSKEYHFRGGRKKKVPTAVALKLKGLKHKGKPIFKVAGLPRVVTEEMAAMQEQPVLSGLRQLTLGPWAMFNVA